MTPRLRGPAGVWAPLRQGAWGLPAGRLGGICGLVRLQCLLPGATVPGCLLSSGRKQLFRVFLSGFPVVDGEGNSQSSRSFVAISKRMDTIFSLSYFHFLANCLLNLMRMSRLASCNMTTEPTFGTASGLSFLTVCLCLDYSSHKNVVSSQNLLKSLICFLS